MPADDPRQSDRLDRLLDDLVAARPLPPDEPPATAEIAAAAWTVHALDAADRSPDPDSRFLRRLESSLMDQAAPIQPHRLPLAPGPSPNGRHPVPRPDLPHPALPTAPSPRRRWWPTVGTAVAALLILAVAGAYLAVPRNPPALPAPEASGGRAAIAPLPATPSPGAVPVHLRIEAIGVDAPIESVSAPEGLRNPPPGGPWVVAWYDVTSPLGVDGNTLLVGHVDYSETGPAVFYRLGNLKPGDRIEVVAGAGQTYTYGVASLRRYQVAALDAETSGDILRPSGEGTLTLVTQAGEFSYEAGAYLERLVVRATPLEDGPPVASPATDVASSATEGSTLTVPDPSECRVAPRPIDDFRALADASASRQSPPVGTPTSMLQPGTKPADPATVAAVTATLHELLACGNAGDGRRVPALYTDALLQ